MGQRLHNGRNYLTVTVLASLVWGCGYVVVLLAGTPVVLTGNDSCPRASRARVLCPTGL